MVQILQAVADSHGQTTDGVRYSMILAAYGRSAPPELLLLQHEDGVRCCLANFLYHPEACSCDIAVIHSAQLPLHDLVRMSAFLLACEAALLMTDR